MHQWAPRIPPPVSVRAAESGPGALRADLGPAGCGSTESRCLLSVRAPPGSHPSPRLSVPLEQGKTSVRHAEHSLVVARVLGLAPSGGAPVRRTTPGPTALRRLHGSSPVGRPVVDPAEPTGPPRSAVNSRLSCEVSLIRLVSTEDAQVARRAADGDRRRAVPGHHSLGRTNTVRPPTTVRRQTGRSPPGVRSGSPGVPERGSVDQRATRSSGACTTSSSVRHTA